MNMILLIWPALGFLGFTLIVLMSIASGENFRIKSIQGLCSLLSLLLLTLISGPIALVFVFSDDFLNSLGKK